MSSHTQVSIIPATIGIALLAGAIYLQLEDGLRAGHLTSIDCLAPVLTIAVAVCGVLCHHRLHAWRVSGLLYLAMALLGSWVIVYSSLARTATAKDGAVATAMAENRTLLLRETELADAKALAKAECKVVGPRCAALQARADKLITDMAGLRAVATDPRPMQSRSW